CEWLDSELQSTFRVRLPRTTEIDNALELPVSEENLSGLAYWTTTQLPRSRDGRFWPLLRDPNEGGRKDAYPLPTHNMARQELDRQIKTDLKWISSKIADPSVGSLLFPYFSKDLTAQSAPWSELLDYC